MLPASPTATATPPCTGDCDHSHHVTISELTKGVDIALGKLPLSECAVFDQSGNEEVDINELIVAVSAALEGCS